MMGRRRVRPSACLFASAFALGSLLSWAVEGCSGEPRVVPSADTRRSAPANASKPLGSKTEVAEGKLSPVRLAALWAAARSGNPAAKYLLSIYLSGHKEAHALLIEAAAAREPRALNALGGSLLLQGKSEEARRLLELATEQGDCPAVLELARCLTDHSCGRGSLEEVYELAVLGRRLAERRLQSARQAWRVWGRALAGLELGLSASLDKPTSLRLQQRARARLRDVVESGR